MLQVEMKRLKQVNEVNVFIIINKWFEEVDKINVYIKNAGSNKLGEITSSFTVSPFSLAYASSLLSFSIPMEETEWLRA